VSDSRGEEYLNITIESLVTDHLPAQYNFSWVRHFLTFAGVASHRLLLLLQLVPLEDEHSLSRPVSDKFFTFCETVIITDT
jgi:hypothetical protein